MVLASVLVFIAFVYFGIMTAYVYGWRNLPEWNIPDSYAPCTPVTVVVAARNEAAQIIPCLESIQNGSYPPKLLEIMVMDDFSTDETAALVRRWIINNPSEPAIRLFRLADILPPDHLYSANKKRAIELAVSRARGAIIVTTDADCLAPADWLRLLASRFEADPKLEIVTAPVVFHREKNMLQYFQSLDFLGMMGITGGGIQLGWHRMGNGANLAYKKTAFEAVGGYSGNQQVASGDDMFLLQKMAARWPGGAGFLKNHSVAVLTEAAPTWHAFWQQRLRWGSKNAALPEWPIRLILLTVWLYCWGIWLTLAGAFTGWISWSLFWTLVCIKAIADGVLLREMCRFFQRKDLVRRFLPAFVLHTAYIPLVGLASLFFKRYTWKGRVVAP